MNIGQSLFCVGDMKTKLTPEQHALEGCDWRRYNRDGAPWKCPRRATDPTGYCWQHAKMARRALLCGMAERLATRTE